MLSPTIVARVTTATAKLTISIGSPVKSMWRNFEVPTGTMLSPTMNTTSPVMCVGKRNSSRGRKRAKTISTRPATMVMPRISGRPPSQAAPIDAAKKLGPTRLGQR